MRMISGSNMSMTKAGNVIQQRQMVYEEDQGSLSPSVLPKRFPIMTTGRQWRQRRKVNPGGAEDNSLDDIALTRFYVDGSVHKSVRKGVNETNPSAIEETHDVIVAYTYDSLGRQLTVTDAMGEVTTYAYHSCCGHLESMTLPGTNRVMVYEYDDAGRVEATINPEGHTRPESTIHEDRSSNRYCMRMIQSRCLLCSGGWAMTIWGRWFWIR